MTGTEPAWRTSTFCSTNACVEIAETPDGVLLRDSKNSDLAPLRFSRAEWAAFVDGVLAGEFSQP